jgi:hypothetical protein
MEDVLFLCFHFSRLHTKSLTGYRKSMIIGNKRVIPIDFEIIHIGFKSANPGYKTNNINILCAITYST